MRFELSSAHRRSIYVSSSFENFPAQHRALDSHTTWISFWGALHDDGAPMAARSYDLGAQVGPWEFWFPNGKLRKTGKLRNGRMDGVWHFFDETGAAKPVRFKDGQMIE